MSEVLLDLSPTGTSGRLVRETMSSHDAKCLALQKIYHAKLQSVWYHDYLEAKEESELRMNVVEETRRVVKMTITFIQENYQKKNDIGERTEASRRQVRRLRQRYILLLGLKGSWCEEEGSNEDSGRVV